MQRYVWLRIVMGASPLTSLHLSGIFLGAGVTFEKAPLIGYRDDVQWLSSIDVPNVASRGALPRIYTAAQRSRTWPLVTMAAAGDGGKLDAARRYAEQHASLTMPPFYFLPFDDDLTTLEYDQWSGDIQRQHRFLDRFDYSVAWTEVIRTVSS
jgi:hypothetical protein